MLGSEQKAAGQLEGRYASATWKATIGVGVGANVLVGVSNRTVALLPVSAGWPEPWIASALGPFDAIAAAVSSALAPFDVACHHIRTGRRQGQGRGLADALAGARHDRDVIRQLHGRISSLARREALSRRDAPRRSCCRRDRADTRDRSCPRHPRASRAGPRCSCRRWRRRRRGTP